MIRIGDLGELISDGVVEWRVGSAQALWKVSVHAHLISEMNVAGSPVGRRGELIAHEPGCELYGPRICFTVWMESAAVSTRRRLRKLHQLCKTQMPTSVADCSTQTKR